MLPKISVITPSFNQGAYIEKTIESILSQHYPQLEYLIIDGGSTDNTLEILQQYDQELDWISEPDEGQAQAINKGFKKATGDIVAWLNSDDIYLPNTLHKVATFFSQNPDVDLVYGDYLVIDAQGNSLLRKNEIPFDFNILLYGLNYIGQPATFFRTRLFDQIGYLNESLHYGMDWEYWLRIGSYGGKLVLLPQYLAAIRWHAQAKSIEAPPEMYAEFQAIRNRYWNKHRFTSPYWQNLYGNWLGKLYRLKRQVHKIKVRHTIDFPPGNWLLKYRRGKNKSIS